MVYETGTLIFFERFVFAMAKDGITSHRCPFKSIKYGALFHIILEIYP
jgi:hypothetical protein